MVQSNDKARYQKLEKAEILEMAVSYVKTLKQTASNSYFSEVIDCNNENFKNQKYYSLAFQQLLNDFQNHIRSYDVNDETKLKFITYLNQRYEELTLKNVYNLTTSVNYETKPKAERYCPYKKGNEKNSSHKTEEKMEKVKASKGLNFSNHSTNESVHQFLDTQNSYKQFISIYQSDRSVDSKMIENSFFTSVCFSNINASMTKEKVWRPW